MKLKNNITINHIYVEKFKINEVKSVIKLIIFKLRKLFNNGITKNKLYNFATKI